jgi:hypothetical protein
VSHTISRWSETRTRRSFLKIGGAALLAGGSGGRAFGDDFRVDARSPHRTLSEGRTTLEVEIPERAFVSIAVLGPKDALLGFDLAGSPAADAARSASPLDEDGILPHVVSFAPRETSEVMEVTVDAASPVDLALVAASLDEAVAPSPKGLADGIEFARPLVGIPAPRSRAEGYFVQVPGRYVFARIDVAIALLGAFEKTAKRYKRDPIAVSEISQWDGKRPRTDLNNPKHISHVGGSDADIAFAAIDGVPSTQRDHCKGVLLDKEHWGCAPGSINGVDVERVTHFLGVLIDASPGQIVKIFMDDAYRQEIIRVAPDLKRYGFIGDEALAALSDDGVIVASPWHTDHFHVRFKGEKGRSPFADASTDSGDARALSTRR